MKSFPAIVIATYLVAMSFLISAGCATMNHPPIENITEPPIPITKLSRAQPETAIAPPQSNIRLSWTASTDPNVARYTVLETQDLRKEFNTITNVSASVTSIVVPMQQQDFFQVVSVWTNGLDSNGVQE